MTNFRFGGTQQLPLVVKNLLIINAIMFLLRYVLANSGIDLDNYLGLHYWQSPLFRWWQLLTHLFMHANLSHIFLNMFALWMFGRILENVWGPKRFLIFYLVCGVGAALCHLGVLTFENMRFYDAFLHYQQHPGIEQFNIFIKHHDIGINPKFLDAWRAEPNAPEAIQASINAINTYYGSMINEATIGASGAVFGVLFGFGYLFPNTELMLIFPPLPVKAKWIVAVYALIELSEGISNSAGDNVAHFAHLGGMLFAFILLRIWGRNIRNRFN